MDIKELAADPLSKSVSRMTDGDFDKCILVSAYAKFLRWEKFPGEIYGPDLKVALESTFPREIAPQSNPCVIPPKSLPKGMDFEDEHRCRYYNPAIPDRPKSVYEMKTGSKILFVPRFTKDGELFRRIVFRRKMLPGFPNEGRKQMMLARFGEKEPFGFSCWKEGDRGTARYVSLAFPGKSETFIPVFLRIDEYPNPVFLKIEAREVENGVLVLSRDASRDEIPEHLK